MIFGDPLFDLVFHDLLHKKAKRGSYKNPFLMSGDIIYIGKSNLNIANEVISEFFCPFTNLYGAYKFFDLDK